MPSNQPFLTLGRCLPLLLLVVTHLLCFAWADAITTFTDLESLTTYAIAGVQANIGGFVGAGANAPQVVLASPEVNASVGGGSATAMIDTVTIPPTTLATVAIEPNVATHASAAVLPSGSTNQATTMASSQPPTSTDIVKLLSSITDALAVAQQNLAADNTSFINGSTTPLDDQYTSWLNQLPTLAQALRTVGHRHHQQLNRPVFDAIGSTTQVMHDFTRQLAAANVISRSSTIRSITAGSALSGAQDAWSRPGMLPG